MKRLLTSLISPRFAVPPQPSNQKENTEESNDSPEEPQAWIGVDLDGTLAHYDGWRGNKHIGKPVPAMLARVRDWMANGYKVKIFTARASVPELIPPIEKWLKKHDLEGLEITNCKDLHMIELWDDRSVQVIANTGNPVRSPSFMSRPRAPLLEESANAEPIDMTFPVGATAEQTI